MPPRTFVIHINFVMLKAYFAPNENYSAPFFGGGCTYRQCTWTGANHILFFNDGTKSVPFNDGFDIRIIVEVMN